MDSETSRNNVQEFLETIPLIRKERGDFSRSLDETTSSGKTPWVRIECVELASTVIEFLAAQTGSFIRAKVLLRSEDVEDLTHDDLIPAGSKASSNKQIEKTLVRSKIEKILEDSHLKRVKRVWTAGEYSIIGDSLTVWPLGYFHPARVEFDADRVERMGIIDVKTWRLVDEVSVVHLGDGDSESGDTFKVIAAGETNPGEKTLEVIIAETGILPASIADKVGIFHLDIRQTEWGEALVKRRLSEGWHIILAVHGNLENARRIEKGFKGISVVNVPMRNGFESARMKVMVLSEQELWGTVQLEGGADRGSYSDLLLDEIHPGDYVVHEDHGVGRYAGIEILEKDGEKVKYLELRYAQKDRLLVPLSQMKKVTKYVGVSTKEPKLTRLGGGEWRRVKKRVTAAVRKLAGELLRLYAAREVTTVSALEQEDMETQAFEKDFPFVETEDQLRAIEDIKEDMRSGRPMDRLLVGDVGFGKTEVAMRAAYVLARTGKQVAVLAPTTVLVEQHFRVFKDRFEKHGIKVDALSRFLTKEQALDVVSRLGTGETSIVVGTHRLLSDDVAFKDLGLLVIDEEQKFGVAQKEKLKKARVETHVLSMSATPIPRTLNMALAGVRDISVIATSPEGRLPIKNHVGKFEWKIVKDVIKKETSRGGQVYFVHNRVTTIETVRKKLSELTPGVRIGVGHGQMSGPQLAKVMRDFHEGILDVLLCTTIIENGLDMPNVNTLIIDRAEMFGLSQLYQIRGRIGRGDRQAYAYFLYHGSMGGRFVKKAILERERETSGASKEEAEEERIGEVAKPVLWEAARQRLDAIHDLEELGSGFALAQRDMEIRGAGNFLGREQHGNVSAIGFSLYCRMLDEMVKEMKGGVSLKE